MIIKILGTGCKKCQKTEENVKEAIKDMKLDATVEKVEDFRAIMSYGVMSTPAIVIDEKVIVSGKVPSVEEIKKMF